VIYKRKQSFLAFWGKNTFLGGMHSLSRENWFEMSDLFSSLLIFTTIKTILSTFFLLFLNFTKIV
jgi:hypothetical protein